MRGFASRRRTLLLGGAGALLFSVGGVLGSRYVKSPGQLAAEAGEPTASLLTALVQRRVLKDTVVLRGTVVAGATFDVAPAAATGRAVLTRLRVKQGDSVAAGQVILEVSGRPVVALAGSVPVYRDLRPGTEGADIAQLQAALTGLGFASAGDSKGFFGPATKRAVAKFYESIGYSTPTTGEADQQAVEALQRSVRGAQRLVEDAQAAVDQSVGATPEAVQAARQLQRAKEDLASARQELEALIRRSGPCLPLSELLFLPSFPAGVVKVQGQLGAEVSGPVLTLATGDLVVQGRLNPGEKDLIKVGMAVDILSELRAVTASGTVASIGEVENVEGQGRVHMMSVSPVAPLDRRLAGDDVRLTVAAAATQGEVLVVPLAAVSAGADGAIAVTKVLPDGGQRRVRVEAGLSGDGFVEVRLVDGELVPGDRVVVGR